LAAAQADIVFMVFIKKFDTFYVNNTIILPANKQ